MILQNFFQPFPRAGTMMNQSTVPFLGHSLHIIFREFWDCCHVSLARPTSSTGGSHTLSCCPPGWEVTTGCPKPWLQGADRGGAHRSPTGLADERGCARSLLLQVGMVQAFLLCKLHWCPSCARTAHPHGTGDRPRVTPTLPRAPRPVRSSIPRRSRGVRRGAVCAAWP